MDKKKYNLIKEELEPRMVKMWTNIYSGDLFFINGLEAEKFKQRYQARFSQKFLISLKIDYYNVVTIPFQDWIGEFILT